MQTARATPLRAARVLLVPALAVVLSACAVLDGPDETFEDASASLVPVTTLQPGPLRSAAPAATPAPTQESVLHGPFRRGGVPVSPGVLADAEELCRSIPTTPVVNEIGSRPVVVTDMRGLGVVLLVFADNLGATGCRVAFGDDGSTRGSFFDVKASTADTLADDDLTLGTIQYLEDGTGQYVLAAGRAGERAAHVRAGFDDDTYVTASLKDGWWAMWWPGQTRPAVIVAGNAKNEAIATVKAPGP